MVVLPKAPQDSEKYAYKSTWRYTLYVPGVISVLCLLAGQWLFVFAHPTFIVFSLYAVVMTVYLLISYWIGVFGSDFDFEAHQKRVAEKRTDFPLVDVYLPCCGEPLRVLRNTYEHVKQLNYPNLKVHVLDDKGEPSVHANAQFYGFNYMTRPNKGDLKKAGNMRYAFSKTQGEFFVVFDADFCPHPEFINELLPYFDDPKVGIVQSPQYFSVNERQTWVERGAGYIQELFYRLIQVSRDHFKAPICVGTNAIYRRAALESHGGPCPIAYSEDVHTGFMISNEGWIVKYVPVCLARGMCPNDLKSFFVQQYRWATGSISLFFNRKFWTSRLSVMQKAAYLSGMLYYITTGLGTIIMNLPAMVLVWGYPDLVFWYNIVFSLPSFFYGVLILPVWTRQPFGSYAICVKHVAYYAHLFALIDKLRGNLMQWQPSGNVRKVERYESFKKLIFYWTCATTAIVLIGIGDNLERAIDFAPMTFFTLFNAWVNLSVFRETA